MFFEIRGGQFHYLWPNTRYTQAPAYADLTTNIVSGGNRDGWFNIPTRNQVLGSFSYFKDGWGGSHNFKIGGEFFDERFDYLRGQDGLGYVPGDVLHILRNGSPSEVLLFQSPIRLAQRSADHRRCIASDTWRASPRLTLTLGPGYDRYQSYLPEQTGPPVGPFNPTQANFPAVDNLITWNLPAPRVGLTYDLTGNGKTVLKANYGAVLVESGTTSIDELVNPECASTGTGGTTGTTERRQGLAARRAGRRADVAGRRRRQHACSIRTSRTRGRASSPAGSSTS